MQLVACFTLLDYYLQQTLENTEVAIKNEQSRETGNIDEEKQIKNTTQNILETTMRKHTQIT